MEISNTFLGELQIQIKDSESSLPDFRLWLAGTTPLVRAHNVPMHYKHWSWAGFDANCQSSGPGPGLQFFFRPLDFCTATRMTLMNVETKKKRF